MLKSQINIKSKMEKTVIGALERVKVNGHEVIARIDTGASRSSIDIDLTSKLKLGPTIRKSTIVSAHGSSVRPVIKAKLVLGGKTINGLFNLTARSSLKHRVLIGRSILKKLNFLVDPSKENV